MDSRQIIRDFVAKELKNRYGGKNVEWTDQESLILSNKTDSLFFVDLIVFLESKFSLKMSSMEIRKEDLDSVDKMVALVDGHA
jgi:acyl carrier protein